MKVAYHTTYGCDLSSVICSKLSAKTERLFNMTLVGNREEGNYIDPARVEADVQALYKAGKGRMGTDERTMRRALLMRGRWETRETKSLESRTRLPSCRGAMDSREGSDEIVNLSWKH